MVRKGFKVNQLTKKGGEKKMVTSRKLKMFEIRKEKVLAFLLLFVFELFIVGSAYARELVVVTNPDSPNVSAEDIRRIYLGFVKSLPDGTPVKPMIMKRVPESFYTKVFGVSEKDFRAHWIRKALSGERVLLSELDEEEIVDLIKSDRGAIGVISADKARKERLKILLKIK